MSDKTQPRSATQAGRTLDWPHKKLRVTKTVEVEWESFPDVRLQDLADEARQELGLDTSHQLEPLDPVPPALTSKYRPTGLRPLKVDPKVNEQTADRPSPLWSFGIFAIGTLVLGVSADHLVSKGFDTILAAAQTREGAIGVGRAMGEYLKSLAPFVRIVFDGIIMGGSIGFSYKVWKRGRNLTDPGSS